MKTQTATHTPTPLKMAYEHDGEIIRPQMVHERLGVSLYQAERICNAVNAHDELVKALKCVKQYADIPGDVMNVVKDALAKAERGK